MQPLVAELGDLGVIGRNRHGLGPAVARLGVEMRVGRAGLRHVRAPGHDVVGVEPLGRLGDVGLFPPGLRRSGRQVAIPVVKTSHHTAKQADVTRARGERHH